MIRILIIGGAGVFGRRLTQMLTREEGALVTIAGRSQPRMDEALRAFGPRIVRSQILDRETDCSAILASLKPHLVIDTSGPFAADAAGDRLARCAIEAGAHYCDIADGRDFVTCFAALDGLAKAHEVAAIAGASSTIALSSAVVDRLAAGMARVDTIDIGITPGNRAPRGEAVMRSILSNAGRPVSVWRGGRWVLAPGWGLMVRRALGVAGIKPIGHRWFSLCDAPDLALFPERYRVQDSVVFRGGLELSFLHLGLWGLSQIVRLGLLRSLAPATHLLKWVADRFERFGADRGGMIVEVLGVDARGEALRRRWTLIAEGGDGPNIPILGPLIIAKRLLRGVSLPSGARTAAGEIALEEFEAEFARLRIKTEMLTLPVR